MTSNYQKTKSQIKQAKKLEDLYYGLDTMLDMIQDISKLNLLDSIKEPKNQNRLRLTNDSEGYMIELITKFKGIIHKEKNK